MSHEIVPVVDLVSREIDRALVNLIPIKILRKHLVVPISRRAQTLTVATSDPTNIFAADELKFITGYNVELVVARKEEIEQVLGVTHSDEKGIVAADSSVFDVDMDKILSETLDDHDEVDDFDDKSFEIGDFGDLISGAIDDVELVEHDDDDILQSNVDAPIIKLVNSILIKAIQMKVSDIHIEPFERVVWVRFRVDGVLKRIMQLPVQIKNPVLSRLKIMSHLDIAERRLPQDGRIKLKIGKKREMDFRVSSLPTLFGEKIVLRLLDKANLQLDMAKLGFDADALKDFQKAIHEPWGMVLVTGPTGSGKTTTLYSALAELNSEDTNIMTAEDPVEYNLMGINQVQMMENIGLNFASALRSFLRQDPDIILVGEIRDFETAEISIKAALTGHLVLSTLHTNDAPSTINRLVNMGVEPFLIANATNLILAQRLARRTCVDCKEPTTESAQILEKMGLSIAEIQKATFMKGRGCSVCGNSGYKGRIALYEVMNIDAEIKEMIIYGATATELKDKVLEKGMDSLRMAALKKMMAGEIALEEIIRVTKAD